MLLERDKRIAKLETLTQKLTERVQRFEEGLNLAQHKRFLDELLDLNEQICLRIDYLRARNDMLMLSHLRLGKQVNFMAPEGRVFGTLIKLNKKSVVIVSEDKKQWKVPPAVVNVVKSV